MKLTFVFTVFLVVLGAMMATVSAYDSCICTADWAPVCGKDGVTYGNLCRLQCAKVKLAYKGVCGSKI